VERTLTRPFWTGSHLGLREEARGWVGSSGGLTEDGGFIGALRFESEEAALANGIGAQVPGWRNAWHALAHDEVRLVDSPAAETLLDLDDAAGFIQILDGRASDIERMGAVLRGMQEEVAIYRPEVTAAWIAWYDPAFTQVVHFTSEEAAREAEGREFSGGFAALFTELTGLVTDLHFTDVREPWVESPGVARSE
jgi:hypothetical protein